MAVKQLLSELVMVKQYRMSDINICVRIISAHFPSARFPSQGIGQQNITE